MYGIMARNAGLSRTKELARSQIDERRVTVGHRVRLEVKASLSIILLSIYLA